MITINSKISDFNNATVAVYINGQVGYFISIGYAAYLGDNLLCSLFTILLSHDVAAKQSVHLEIFMPTRKNREKTNV